MLRVTELPCELVAGVLSSLDTLEDLVNAICACRHFYTAFIEYPSAAGNIASGLLAADVLPLAVAAAQVGKPGTGTEPPAPDGPDGEKGKGVVTAESVSRFVDGLARNRTLLMRQLRGMSLRAIYAMLDTDAAITDLTFDFADRAWEQFYFDHTRAYFDPARGVGLSLAEAFRFCRAFYRFEILVRAFRVGDRDRPDEGVLHEARLWLVHSFAQFEVEQIACVHDYLERRFMIACLRTFIEDVELGAMGVDFLSPGANPHKQHWISQGCAFITRLAKASTEYKGILLKETLQQTDSAAPFATLAGIRDVFLANRRTATLHPRDKLDTDPGPPSTFDYANADLLDPEGTGEVGATTTAEGAIGQVAGAGGAAAPPTGPAGGAEGADSIVPIIVSMTPEDAGIRERAYVLWDMARVKDWNLWEQIEISPREATTTPTRAQYSTMRQLWRAHRDKWAERHGAPWYISLTDEETVRLMNIFKLWGEEALATEPWDNGEEEEWVDE